MTHPPGPPGYISSVCVCVFFVSLLLHLVVFLIKIQWFYAYVCENPKIVLLFVLKTKGFIEVSLISEKQ